MKDAFLVEVGVEELPSRHSRSIIKQLTPSTITEIATSCNLTFENHQLFVSPRRIALTASAVSPIRTTKEIKGPLYEKAFGHDKPTRIGVTFAKAHGLEPASLEIRDVRGKKFVFAVHSLEKNIESDIELFVRSLIEKITFDKPMRWDDTQFRFSRPIRWIACLLGRNIVPFTYLNVTSGRKTKGPRFLGSKTLSIPHAKQYEDLLAKHKVIVDHMKRSQLIKKVIQKVQDEYDLTVIDTQGVLHDEVPFLVEYPHPIVCTIKKEYLSLPTEVIATVLTSHQKCFPFTNAKTGTIAPYFVAIANHYLDSPAIKRGNENVVHARLRDAMFFYQKDKKIPLTAHAKKTESIVFQEKLGTMCDKSDRIAAISQKLAANLSIHEHTVLTASALCKADLGTYLVSEFASLQGIVGRIYAESEGIDKDVCEAIEEHYLPRHSEDSLPSSTLGIILAIADRIDTITSLWSVGVEPKGTSDPYGIRRAGIAIVRILWETELPISLDDMVQTSIDSSTKPVDKSIITTFLLSRLEQYLKDTVTEKLYPATEELRAVLYNSDPVLVNKKVTLATYVKRRSDKEFEQMLELIKRIYNIAIKPESTTNSPEGTDNVQRSSLNESERKLLDHVEELSTRETITITDIYTLIEPCTKFFEKNMIMSDKPDERARRLAILQKTHDVILRVINPKYLLS